MRVLLAGAIGRSLVPQLVAAGHDVTGTTRSEQRAEAIRAAGARAAVCDVLDAKALRAAAVEAAPDVVVHELTALRARLDPHNKRVYDATNRVRRDGTANLLTAARAARARRFICQSIAFAYTPARRPQVMAENAPLFLAAPAPFGLGGRWGSAARSAAPGIRPGPRSARPAQVRSTPEMP
jgi:nucleoside-diphosphate-sugar epimerase